MRSALGGQSPYNVLVAAAMLLPSLASRTCAEPIAALRFEDFRHPARSFVGNPTAERSVDISGGVTIRVAADTLAREVAALLPPSTPHQALARLLTLDSLLQQSEELPVLKAEALAAWAAENSARAAGAPGTALTGLTSQTDSRNARFARRALAVLDGLEAYETRFHEGRGLPELESMLESPTYYEELPSLLRQAVEDLGRDLQSQLAQRKFKFQLVAAQYGVGLGSHPVHLPGYDDLEEGPYQPFERYQISPDERTRAEVEAARQMKPYADDLLDGRFSERLKEAVVELKKTLAEIEKQLRAETLQDLGDRLRAELSAGGSADENSRALLKDLDEIATAVTSLAGLIRPAETVADSTRDVLALLNRSAALLSVLENRTRHAVDLLPKVLPRVSTSLRKDLESALRSQSGGLLAKVTYFQDMAKDLRGLARAADGHAEIKGALDRLRDLSHQVELGDAQPTRINFKRLPARPHDGDELDVRIRVLDSENKALYEGEQALLLRAEGVFLEARGFLMLGNPQHATGGERFKASPAIGWFLHYGAPRHEFWNDFVRLGIGVSLATVDFDPQQNFELGLAGSIAFARDIFVVGYGNDLHANRNFLQLGINPVAAGQLAGAIPK